MFLSSLIMVRDAVRAGVGAARLPISLVSHDIADGTLQRWSDIEGSEIALWALSRLGVSWARGSLPSWIS
jgi:DNA-binding transcriptional LysR family regulator